METKPGVVEPKPHKWKEKVDLLVDLRHGVPDGHLEVSIVIVAPLVKERVQLALSDCVQSVWSDHIFRHSRVSIAFRVGWGSISGCPGVYKQKIIFIETDGI